MVLSNMVGEGDSAGVAAPAPTATASPSVNSEDEIAEAPDRIIWPIYERFIEGGVICENFMAFHVAPELGYRRIESGSCVTPSGITVTFMAYKNAVDRSVELRGLAQSYRDLRVASRILFGDDWAVMCDRPAVLLAAQHILGGTILT
ncbi:hypothetical protein GCM10010140_46790 [Streptosporangium pseudovulgare]|uniref:Uncharacterized protein n=1 Tax=Streptosporangium pseudovulgare TaxID=35765 RepID=A0ABQ2R5P7_9ACTN|nr:hypothetical protein GCM10010140_46790 [Streptosporangium pseudovulgare]